eukprot:TRINITY_DN11895_c0_g2_i1.p1 TRINITY_DN11895_c0_g2~~TRINITY_DN11895_c0_g2_i1.p1  ORF type:complete len:168 (+),score=55.62 TRINITY_DN11895_c0_g2_i1:59-562(+)
MACIWRAPVLACMIAFSAAGTGRTEFRVTYVDRGSVFDSIPLPGDNWAEVEENEVDIKREGGGLFDGLVGKCVAMTPTSPTDPNTSGWCKFADADGDETYEYYTGLLTPGTGGEGTAVFSNGTGKYKDLRAEHTWTYYMTRHSDDAYEGRGQKHGHYWYLTEDGGEL